MILNDELEILWPPVEIIEMVEGQMSIRLARVGDDLSDYQLTEPVRWVFDTVGEPSAETRDTV